MANSYFNSNTPDIVLKSLFSKYDNDNSDQLGNDELKSLFRDDLGLTDDQAEMYTLLLDKDGTGSVCFEEFVKWFRSGEKMKTLDDSSRFACMQKAVEMFNGYDKDGSQSLDKAELSNVLKECGGQPDTVDSAMASLDLDGNGKISFVEFVKWLNWVPMDSFT